MRKTVVYSLSRSFDYENIVPSINSMILNGNVDDIYILAEDNDLGFELPPQCHVLNLSRQTYFPSCGPNYYSPYTYMSLMQAALTKIFPDLDRILNIDCDTVIVNDISELWDLDLENYYFAAAPEQRITLQKGYLFVNTGVAMFNLAKMRADRIDDQVIDSLNRQKWMCVNQDCLNELCRGKIFRLSCKYNASPVTGIPVGFKIRHFASIPTSVWINDPLVEKYKY